MVEIPKADTYGGVLISMGRKVLLREPTGHFGGYAWTFAKGAPKKGEVPARAALRHVREETGYDAEILEVLPQVFAGATSTTAFAIMGPLGRQHEFGPHTAATRWVDQEDAEALIRHTATEAGRDRDLAILRAAYAAMDSMGWAQRPATCAEDWQIQPMPERQATLAIDWLYDARAAFRIQKGCFPTSMDQKWFMWFEEPVLHMHRSWTGYCVFQVTFKRDGDGLRAVSVLANRDPRQYTETDDTADWSLVVQTLDHLFVSSPDEPYKDGFLEALAVAMQPNYLGSPPVVSGLLQEVIDASTGYYRGEWDFNGAWNLIWNMAQEISTGPEYVRMEGWHTPQALGKALVKAFGVRDEPFFADDLSYFVSEALSALFMKVRDLLVELGASPKAEWEPSVLTRIEDLRDWSTAVFIGTGDVLHPGRTVGDF